MTQIFISHTSNDAECAEQLRQGLEAKSYSTWREPTSLSMESILYPRTIENIILSSAAVILVWSSSAATAEWVQRHILFTQRLKKLIVPVVIDGTDLLPTLIVDTVITSQVPCADSLITLSEQAAHEFIRERKEAIDHAAEMLKQHEHREEDTETEEEKEKKQPDFLDEAAKSIIERIATFLAILFAVIALGGTFPPKFLVHNTQNTALVIAILICYLVAMGMGMWSIQPRNYSLYQYNLTRQDKNGSAS